MSSTLSAIHVRTRDRALLLATVRRRMSSLGFVPLLEPTGREPVVRRIVLKVQRDWITVVEEDPEDAFGGAKGWARRLSQSLATDAVAAWFWDGEARLSLTLYGKGKLAHAIALPDDATVADGGKVAITLGAFSRLVGDGARSDGLILRLSADDDWIMDGEVVYTCGDASHAAFSRAFGIPRLFLETPTELDEGAFEFLFFPRPVTRAKT